MAEAARIVIADDHDLMREGIRSMVESAEDLEVVGEAANGHEAVELCRGLRPDLVLMDVRMPRMDGLEATRVIKAENPKTIVLMVTTYADPDYLIRAVQAGAAGYLLKDTARREFVSSVRSVLDGDHALDGNLAMKIIQRIGAGEEPAPPPLEDPLTPREAEILRRLALGETNPEISRAIHVSQSTVKAGLRRILQKLEVSDRTQAAVKAVEMGLVKR
ncbi:MAG: response regulator transcription factor [Rubrobacter sp.]|nr:response regulator transcription factor [Rubrobacter sp.]